ncbi:MAG: L,D-transpeptidase family protein [Elusimicrobiota bacterium]
MPAARSDPADGRRRLPCPGISSKMGRRRAILAGLCLGALCAIRVPAAAQADREQRVAEGIRRRIETAGLPARISSRHERVHARLALPAFYERRGFLPAWVAEGGLNAGGRRLLAALRDADREGLRPEDYHLSAIEALPPENLPASPRARDMAAEADILMTDAFLVYASHLLSGRLNPQSLDAEWHVHGREGDVERVLEDALASGEVSAALRGLLPRDPGYWKLREALAHYRSLGSRTKWTAIPSAPVLRPGARRAAVALLRRRLAVLGDIERTGTAAPELYDEELERAVRRFQARHGLDADGVAGARTIAEINVSPARRAQQIVVNMERWRWMPQDFGDRHILVNVPDFSLRMQEDGREALRMSVIIGRAYRRTPMFSDRMTYLVLNPSWNVPRSIAVADKLPEIQRDPRYLKRQRMRVYESRGGETVEVDPDSVGWASLNEEDFPYRLVQEPGPLNALGRIKFMLPNEFSVYLHDTPDRRLFAEGTRTFSSGCIRVERPLELAVRALEDDPAWSRESILAAIEAGEERTVRLPRPIPVHLLYWTAWAEGDGAVHFRRDVYERDEAVALALLSTPPEP